MTKTQRYRVLGIDPGLNITGYGIVDFAGAASQPTIIEGGAIRTDAKADIARRIEDEMEYPGEIKVTLIRETRCVEYAR